MPLRRLRARVHRSLRAVLPGLLLAPLLAGCGKSGVPLERSAGLNPVAPVASQGAAGQVTRNTTRLGGADPTVDAAAVASAVHPGLVAAGRPQAVVFVGAKESNWPVALAASALSAAPLGAPVLFSTAHSLPEPTERALQEMSPTGAALFQGAQVLDIGRTAVPSESEYRERSLGGRDPYTIAAEIAGLVEGMRTSAPRQVLVVDAEGPPAFAMPAAGLAAESATPILLVGARSIPAPTAGVLSTLRHPSIYIIGPPAAISEATAKALERYGAVTRIDGPTPAANAVAVARFGEGSFGWNIHEPGHGLVFASAARPLDAAAAAPLSATGDFAPLLLLEGPSGVPAPLSDYLEDIRAAFSAQVPPTQALYNHGWIIGDGRAISAVTQDELDADLEIADRSNAPASPAFSP